MLLPLPTPVCSLAHFHPKYQKENVKCRVSKYTRCSYKVKSLSVAYNLRTFNASSLRVLTSQIHLEVRNIFLTRLLGCEGEIFCFKRVLCEKNTCNAHVGHVLSIVQVFKWLKTFFEGYARLKMNLALKSLRFQKNSLQDLMKMFYESGVLQVLTVLVVGSS